MHAREFILDVYPKIPERLSRLDELAGNLWYSWHRPTRALFSSLDRGLWGRVGHNPKLFLRRVEERALNDAAEDEIYLGHYHEVLSAYDNYHRQTARAEAAEGLAEDDLIAYFCAEYGLHESLHIYSGGLGILSGHHCKTASDMRLPFVAVGLLYRAGYFSQTIDDEGNQSAHYVEVDFDELPISPATDAHGKALEVSIPFPGRKVHARVWMVRAGHVTVFLLDTDVEANAPDDRRITHQLYGGNFEMRIEQELVLGVGGVRALRSLGLLPTVWHLNEGHPAFSILERIQEYVAAGQEFETALQAVAANTVFTTHTPVPAGHDHFPDSMIRPYLETLLTARDVSIDEVLALGHTRGQQSDFNMTTFAIRGSRYQNGVSRLHGEVSATICRECWPQIPPEENSMSYVTNGVHIATVLAQDWSDLFDRFLGKEWRSNLCDRDYWRRIHEIPEQLFWSVKQASKSRTLAAIRESLIAQCTRNQMSAPHIDRIVRYLDPEDPNILTIAFARRFATYKRAALLFNDIDRLRALMSDTARPLVIIFAGKAHPADAPGQALLKRVHEVGTLPEFVGRILLVEGYDLELARRLLAGVDVWLNNPIYTMEASGTSGMKAAVNGTLHLSVADGWWAEGYEGDNGWAIRPSPHGNDEVRRDAEDARTLYEILEDRVIPLYYDHGKLGYSPGWVSMAKRSMSSVLPRFNMNRVLEEYTRNYYAPAAASGRRITAGQCKGAQALAQWRRRVESAWPRVALRLLEIEGQTLRFGASATVEVAAQLDSLTPEDVSVELVLELPSNDPASSANVPNRTNTSPVETEATVAHFRFTPAGILDDTGEHHYRLEIRPEHCGRLRYRIRMFPNNELQAHRFETGLMVWLDT